MGGWLETELSRQPACVGSEKSQSSQIISGLKNTAVHYAGSLMSFILYTLCVGKPERVFYPFYTV